MGTGGCDHRVPRGFLLFRARVGDSMRGDREWPDTDSTVRPRFGWSDLFDDEDDTPDPDESYALWVERSWF